MEKLSIYIYAQYDINTIWQVIYSFKLLKNNLKEAINKNIVITLHNQFYMNTRNITGFI